MIKKKDKYAALCIVAAQPPQRIALHICPGEAPPYIVAKGECKCLVLAVAYADAAALAAKLLHFVQHELPRPLDAPALPEHLKGALVAGPPYGANAEHARHGRCELAYAPVLGKVVHGFQRKKQVGAAFICIQGLAYLVKARAGALLGQRLFYEKGYLRACG